MKKKTPTPKKKKKPFHTMKVTKYKLDPAQAVLSCCSQASRITVSGGNQCGGVCGVFDVNNMSS